MNAEYGILYLCLGMCLGSIEHVDGLGGNMTKAAEIFKSIFTQASYNANIRPVLNDSDALLVNVYMELLAVHFLDEKSETFKTTAYLNLEWDDKHLGWNETIYDVTSLTYSQSAIWTPELVLTNSFERYRKFGDDSLKLMVTPNGTVTWETIEVLTSTCKLDITYFPFDIQTCDINFVVWNYFREDVRLVPKLATLETGLHKVEVHPGWEILSMNTSKGNLRKSSVTFSVTLKRKAAYYIQNFVLPILMLSVLILMTFVLPHDSGERASYSITVFLSMVVMQTILNSVLPESANTCIFTVYLISETMLATLMTIVNIVLLRVVNFTHETEVPSCLRAIVNGCCRKRAVSPVEGKKADIDSMVSHQTIDEEEVHVEWIDVVQAMDRLCFFGFSVVTCLVTVVMLSVCSMGEMMSTQI